jgi:hypothetical protein
LTGNLAAQTATGLFMQILDCLQVQTLLPSRRDDCLRKRVPRLGSETRGESQHFCARPLSREDFADFGFAYRSYPAAPPLSARSVRVPPHS